MKVLRLHHAFAAALGTYVVALLSNGNSWVTTVKIAAPISMGLGVIGASLFHYGAAHRMYGRKVYDRVEVKQPLRLIVLGLAAMATSILVALLCLPGSGVAIMSANALVVILYARVLARHWVTKNMLIAAVCSTPAIMGWVVGHRLFAGLPMCISSVFFAQWAREIRKDIADIRANHGERITLPMVVGITGARKIAGVMAAASLGFLLALAATFAREPLYAQAPYGLALAVSGVVAAHLLIDRDSGQEQHLITAGNWCLLLALFCVRLHRG